MLNQSKTTFISYRRTTSWAIARSIQEALLSKGNDVFRDNDMDNGPFDVKLLQEIQNRTNFLLILSKGSLRNCEKPNDWLRREIEHALDKERNIVPVLVDGYRFEREKQFLTGKLSELPRYQAVRLSDDYFQAGIDKIHDRFLR